MTIGAAVLELHGFVVVAQVVATGVIEVYSGRFCEFQPVIFFCFCNCVPLILIGTWWRL